ncbi:SseB family protein [Nocardioides marmoribigeumensis]|uniref:SseB protein N-terminal domain-containing protein n=1 Tax=Nocardioides marmoribigeumensis TaxID=433649 RepID=A0ABU2BXK9_9ACTN|nr:SseB family protein [Nocardioides marmoribigeumensis]MDR7363135.1 hypothetical protein [Nocardioides marmoribigeumensis]
MSAPVFPDPWDFLTAWVLVVADGSGRLQLLQDPDGGTTLPVRTDLEEAQRRLPPGHRLLQAPVGELLAGLPEGVSVSVDPGSESGMHVPADLVVGLRRLLAPVPDGSSVGPWTDLPADVSRRLAGSTAQGVQVWALAVDVPDGPRLGLLVHDVAHDDQEARGAAEGALLGALEGREPSDLGVAGVRVAGLDQLPADAADLVTGGGVPPLSVAG